MGVFLFMAKYNKEEQELKEEIHEQFIFSKRYLDSIHQRMNDQEELYRTYIDKNNYPHGARVFDPRVFRVIETVTPRMVANEPTGSFYPFEGGDVVTTQILNALMKYDWRRAEMFPKLVEFVKAMLIFGTSFGRTYWDFRERAKTRMIPKEINGRVVWTPKNAEQVTVTEFDGPNFETLNIYDCFPDPNASNIHNLRWFIYRTFKTLDELKAENETRGEEYYQNLKELEKKLEDKKKKKMGDSATEGMQYREHRRVMLSTEELKGEDISNPDIVIFRRFTRDGWCDYAVEHDLILREVENPYFHGDIPIVYGVDYTYPGELYGMGEIEPVDRVQRAINAVLNQRLDNVQLTLRTMWKVKKNSGVDMHTLVSSPGNIITTNDMTAVEPVQIPDVTGATFVQTMNYLTSALQNGTGITDYTTGINSNAHTANETATGTRLIQQEANAQFKLKVQLLNHMVIQRVANQWKDLRIQYTTEAQKLRIIGREQVDQMKQDTDLAKIDMEGNPIVPGDLEVQSKLELSKDGNFAFLNLMPEDIQPAIVGDYDFIASVSSDQLNDPIALQENFFLALDKIKDPAWVQGLASQQKQLNYTYLTEKVFDKLQLGIEAKDVLSDIQPPEMMGQGQPMPQEMMDQVAAAPVGNPLPPVEGGLNGQA
jgi:hypothetical protein